MKKNKKIIGNIIGISLAALALAGILTFILWLTLGKHFYIYHKISSVEDLYAMKSGSCYQLTCDLDLEEREWQPLSVKGFNGNGYTIKNCYINETTEYYAGGFFPKISWLENVVFENIQSRITFTNSRDSKMGTYESYNGGGIIAGHATEAIGVTVRNSNVIFNIGYSDVSIMLGGIAGTGMIKNSTVENSSITCNNTSYNRLISIGGIVGGAFIHTVNNNDIVNNKVLNSEIHSNSKSAANAGGILGSFWFGDNGNKIDDCVTKDCIIDVQSSSSNISRAGGIIGNCPKDNEIYNCAATGNNIKVISSSGYNIGGIAGKTESKITDCLSDYNILEGGTSSTNSNTYAGVGGLCGSSYATISKSIAQNNKIIGSYSTKSNDIFAAGFIAKAEASIANCATYNNLVNGGNTDIFTSKNESLLFDCYSSGTKQYYPNVNNIPILSEMEWENIIQTLSLDKELWNFDNGYLSLKICDSYLKGATK